MRIVAVEVSTGVKVSRSPLDAARPRRGPSARQLSQFGALLLLLAALAPPAGGADRRTLPPHDDDWIELRTTNFVFVSNAAVAAARRVALDLEELRAVLGQLTSFELRSPVPTTIYVFKSDRSFAPYKTLYRGRPAAVSGYFLSCEHGNYIALTADSRSASEILYHEYVHEVVENNLWYLPVWLNEGLAEFYQTFEVSGDRVSIGLPNRFHVRRLGGRTLVPFEELIEVSFDSPLYNETYRKNRFYAQAWALTHYLLLGDDARRAQLDTYLRMLRAGTPAAPAFAAAFGDDFDALEAEVRRHVRGPLIPALRATAEIDVDRRYTVRELSRAELLYRLGDLLSVQRPERDDDLLHFEAALEADPSHSPSWTALAVAAEERADWSAAEAAHRRAVAAGPDDFLAHYRWGQYLQRRGSDPQDAVDALRRAVELRPSFAPAWDALASAYDEMADTSPAALEAAETAHQLLPGRAQAADRLLRLSIRRDDRERAAEVIATAFPRDPQRAGAAWDALLHNDLERARQLLAAGDVAGARARLELARADLAGAARQEAFREGIAAAELEISRRVAADLYERASRLYMEGAASEARGLLQQVLDALPAAEPVAWSAEQLLHAIEHPLDAQRDAPAATAPSPEEVAELNRLLAARDLEAALLFLEELRGRSNGLQQKWVDGKIAELRWILDYNRYVELFNRAVDAYNSGDHRQAAEVLEGLLETLPPGPQRDEANELLEDARAAMAGP